MHWLDYGQPPPSLRRLVLRASLPPAVAIVAWPVLYFTMFLNGLVLIWVVLIACAAWADAQSKRLVPLFAPHFPKTPVTKLRRRILALQGLGIVGSWPLFAVLLHELRGAGFKVGWS